ncbi:MAG: nickel-dependent lactate racemase, partial [Ignavibacteria bacterium]|nr:nickel-dependent lactate racemase [Ignavibacteria bacterium]
MMKRVSLAYGKKGLEVEVPEQNLVAVLSMDGAQPLRNPEEELRRSLEQPIGSRRLADLAAEAKSACVVICDITRPVPNTLILPPVLETLERSGIDREAISILVATGLHRPSTVDELNTMIGEDLRSRYRVVNHRARAREEQRYFGNTVNNTPVYIDEVYCSADLKITTGYIEPHLMAGFSGGRKLVAPGCAGEDTIKALHSPLFLENPRCAEGSIEGNPLHEELLTISGMAGHDFIVNVSLDAAGRTTGVFAGEFAEAHAAGVRHVRQAVKATVEQPVDIVVTTSAGFPLDLTYYQAVKGITAALPIVKEGGMLICAAECAEGLGSAEFARMATTFSTADEFLDTILSQPVVIDQWQLEECAKAVRHAEVVLVSGGLTKEQRDRLFIRTEPSVEDAIRRGLQRHGSQASIAVIPKGPYTLVGI